MCAAPVGAVVAATTCSENQTATTGKCPFVPCVKSAECQSNHCDYEKSSDQFGECEPIGIDLCLIDPTVKFNKCLGTTCSRDRECQSEICGNGGLCESETDIESNHGSKKGFVTFVIIVIIVILAIGGGFWYWRKRTAAAQAVIAANQNLTAGGSEMQPLVINTNQ